MVYTQLAQRPEGPRSLLSAECCIPRVAIDGDDGREDQDHPKTTEEG